MSIVFESIDINEGISGVAVKYKKFCYCCIHY